MSSVRPLNTVIIGAAGRMGRALIRAATEIPDELRVCGAVASTTSASLGKDAGELAGVGRLDLRVTDDLAAALARAEIVIDFSQPHTTRSNLMVCRAARKPLLIGTTGFPAELTSAFDEAASCRHRMSLPTPEIPRRPERRSTSSSSMAASNFFSRIR